MFIKKAVFLSLAYLNIGKQTIDNSIENNTDSVFSLARFTHILMNYVEGRFLFQKENRVSINKYKSQWEENG